MRSFSETLRPNILKHIGWTTKLKLVADSTCHGLTFLSKTLDSKTILTL